MALPLSEVGESSKSICASKSKGRRELKNLESSIMRVSVFCGGALGFCGIMGSFFSFFFFCFCFLVPL